MAPVGIYVGAAGIFLLFALVESLDLPDFPVPYIWQSEEWRTAVSASHSPSILKLCRQSIRRLEQLADLNLGG